MAEGWSWNRISSVDQAILIEAYCEVKATAIEKNIVIDQAIVTTKHYSEEKSVPYINAILDKIL
jgi:N utilization substance protein B